ncbi:SpnT protein, partial [Escherichia coli]|nr:SpnT protein [Escherichia coli]
APYSSAYTPAPTPTRITHAENSMNRYKIKLYTYAAIKMKKSIDYSKDIAWTEKIPSTEEYLKSLFIEHKRKYALWEIMLEKIAGLAI